MKFLNSFLVLSVLLISGSSFAGKKMPECGILADLYAPHERTFTVDSVDTLGGGRGGRGANRSVRTSDLSANNLPSNGSADSGVGAVYMDTATDEGHTAAFGF